MATNTEPIQQNRPRRWALAVHRPLRWGVAGTGLIASDMMAVASMIPGVTIQAVGAREDEDKAKAFVSQHGAPSRPVLPAVVKGTIARF